MHRVFDKLKPRAVKKKKKAGGNVEDIEINFSFFFYSMFSECIEFILFGIKKKESFREKLFDNILMATLENFLDIA